MKKQKTTQENLNKIIEFRQAIYEKAFEKRRDALFETWDALMLRGEIASFPMLSLSKVFRRKWHSMYKAMEQGEINEEWLASHLARQVPQEGLCYFSLDGSAWPRPRARTMDDRQYVYLPTAAVNGGSICIGYSYSLLDWVPEPQSSWSLSVNVRRIPSTQSAKLVGIEQVKALNEARKPCRNALDIVAAGWQVWECSVPASAQRPTLWHRRAVA